MTIILEKVAIDGEKFEFILKEFNFIFGPRSLPSEYVDSISETKCWKRNGRLHVFPKNCGILPQIYSIGDRLTEDEFVNLWNNLTEASENLKRINEKNLEGKFRIKM